MMINNKLVTVYCQNGEYYIKTPNGEQIPCLKRIKVFDNWPNRQPCLVAEMDCNIASNNIHFDLPVKLYNHAEYNEITEDRDLWKKKCKDLEYINSELISNLELYRSKWWYKLFKNL